MAQMTQEEADAWIAAHGGRDLQHGIEQKRVPNPLYNEAKGPTPSNPQYIDIEVETWTNSKTGAKLTAKHQPDGSWERVDAVDADPNKPSTTTRTPEQQQVDAAQAQSAQAENREKQWNSDHGYGWVTHAQRAEQVRQQEAQARADNNQARLVAAQEAQNQLARDRLQFDQDKANLPDVKATDVTINGTHYTRVTSVTPQGATTIKNYGPDGKPIAALPTETKPSAFGPEPDAPPLGMTPAEMVQGLQTYSGYLAGQVKLYRDTGGKQGVSSEDAAAKMEQRIKVAEAAINQQNTATSQATTLRGQDITDRGISAQLANSRLSTAGSIYNQTLGSYLPQIKFLAPGKGGNMAAAMQATLDGGLSYARAFGGLQDVPPVGYGGFPALDQIRQGSQVAINTAASGGPRIFNVNPGASTQPPPAAAPQFDPAAAAAAEAARQAGSAQVAAQNAQTPQTPPAAPPPAVNPISTAPISAPQVTQPRPDQTQVGGQIDNAIMPPAAPTVPPLPAAPEVDPLLNVRNKQTGEIKQVRLSQINDASDKDAFEVLDPNSSGTVQPGGPPMPAAPMPSQYGAGGDTQSMTPRFIQQARYGVAFDPHAASAGLVQRLGIPPEIMQQALGNLYG